jgi:anti-sigma factor RsiW
MSCTEMQLLLQAEIDGELDAASCAAVAGHVAQCASCAHAQIVLRALSTRVRTQATRYEAPARLRAAMLQRAGGVAPEVSRPRAWWRQQATGFSLGMALAACVAFAVLTPGHGDEANEVIASHLRALQPGHLTDVVSTDRHTVKPWFDGRLDFAPPVRDFAANGFPLKGGRLDYVAGRPVAALVYGRALHMIDVYAWPGQADRKGAERGYNFVAWTQNGMALWAVSDLNMGELVQFRELWKQGQGALPAGPPP